MPTDKILLVEDDHSLREVIASILESEGFAVDKYYSAEEGLQAFQSGQYACVLADFKLPGQNGIDLLKQVRQISQSVPFLLMTAYGSIQVAIDAMREGANDFLCKPFEPALLCTVIRDTLTHKCILQRSLGTATKRERNFLTGNADTQALLQQARKAAKFDTPVLLLGESGTGKELISRFIHDQSPRREKPFVAVNCAAMPAELLESEFFGHEAGAFTGATQARIGVLEYASQGTVFLDEIGDMPPNLQVKLLRALRENEIRRVGNNQTIKVNPRIIAATNKNIEEALQSGALREDFYYRLAVLTLNIPPLRERKEDIDLLTKHYVEYFCSQIGKRVLAVDQATTDLLRRYAWPGNARELENVIERAVILAEENITPEHLGISATPVQSPAGQGLTLLEVSAQAARQAEVDLILRTLKQTDGNKSRAAEVLGVSYKTLLNKIKEYALENSQDLATN